MIYRYTFYMDKNTERFYPSEENKCLKGIKAEQDCNKTEISEETTRYKIVVYDNRENGWGYNGVARKARLYLLKYIFGMESK